MGLTSHESGGWVLGFGKEESMVLRNVFNFKKEPIGDKWALVILFYLDLECHSEL